MILIRSAPLAGELSPDPTPAKAKVRNSEHITGTRVIVKVEGAHSTNNTNTAFIIFRAYRLSASAYINMEIAAGR